MAPEVGWSLVPQRCLVTIQASIPAVKGDASAVGEGGGQSKSVSVYKVFMRSSVLHPYQVSKGSSSMPSRSKMCDGVQLLAVARHIERLADIVGSEDYATSEIRDTSLEYL